MKKLVALFAIGAYLTISNYCLAYALVTGEFHNPYHSSETRNTKLPSHPGCQGHDDENSSSEKSDHHSHDENGSGPCCVKLNKCLESVLPQATVVSIPSFILENILVPIPQRFIDLHLAKIWLTNHGPPGVKASQGFLSSSSSRAPPFFSPSL